MTVALAGESTYAVLLASVRVVAWLVLAPPFSSRAVPPMAKVILALALSFAAAPVLTESRLPTETVDLLLTVVTQVLVGTAMGFLTSLLFSAIAAAGSLIDVFGGFALAQAFDPLGVTSNTVIGSLHQMLATLLLFASGGHLLVIGGLIRTFELLPVGTSPDLAGGPDLLIRAFTVFFLTAVQIALPMAAVLFLADLGLALMTKIAPQLNALNVMFPAKIGLTLLLVGLSVAVLPGAVESTVELILEAMATLAGGGAP
jgi:flagellar biosynthetic protein FliR